jgi:hypothetical protein
MRSRRGIAVGRSGGGEVVRVLLVDGPGQTVVEARRDKVRLVEGTGPRSEASCGAGEVLAAALADDVPPRLREALVGHAIAIADQGGVREQRAFVLDAFALTDPVPIIARVGLSDSERLWWHVVALWQIGEAAEAVKAMLRLPEGRYPLRLAMLWQAANAGHVPDAAVDQIVTVASHLSGLSPAVDVAARLVARAVVTDRRDPKRAADLTKAAVRAIGDAQSDSPWTAVGRWFRGEVGDAPRNRLVGALRSSPGRLGEDPAILDAAPPAVLDDLIDQAAVPEEWIDRADELACGAHLLARTRIGMLDEDGLRRAGAVDELARRWARDGRGLPPDVAIPDDVRDRYAALAQARAHDESSLLALAQASHVATGDVRDALADPTALPAADLVTLPQVAEALADRSAVDVSELVPDQLTDDQRRFVGQVLLRRAKTALHEWDLDGAEAAAAACLRFARNADVHAHDEALNLLAAVHWQRGDDGLAQGALDATRRGDEVDGLLVNAAVVAAGVDRRTSTTRLLRIVDQASDPGLRVRAALASSAAIDDPVLQSAVVRSLRAVVGEPIPVDDFARVVSLLSTFDPSWLARPGALEGAAHADSPAARAYVAWAAGRLDDHVAALAEALADAHDSSPLWARQRRDLMVDSVIADLGAVPERRTSALVVGFTLLRARVPMDAETGIEVRARVVAGASQAAESADVEPQLDIVDWLVEAVGELANLAQQDRLRLGPLVSVGSSELCRVVVVQRGRQLARFEDLIESRWAIEGEDLRGTVRLGLDLCERTTALVRRLRPVVTATHRNVLDELAGRCDRLAASLRRLVGGSQP